MLSTIKDNPLLTTVNDNTSLTIINDLLKRKIHFWSENPRSVNIQVICFDKKKHLKPHSKRYLSENKLKLIVIKLIFITESLFQRRSFFLKNDRFCCLFFESSAFEMPMMGYLIFVVHRRRYSPFENNFGLKTASLKSSEEVPKKKDICGWRKSSDDNRKKRKRWGKRKKNSQLGYLCVKNTISGESGIWFCDSVI